MQYILNRFKNICIFIILISILTTLVFSIPSFKALSQKISMITADMFTQNKALRVINNIINDKYQPKNKSLPVKSEKKSSEKENRKTTANQVLSLLMAMFVFANNGILMLFSLILVFGVFGQKLRKHLIKKEKHQAGIGQWLRIVLSFVDSRKKCLENKTDEFDIIKSVVCFG